MLSASTTRPCGWGDLEALADRLLRAPSVGGDRPQQREVTRLELQWTRALAELAGDRVAGGRDGEADRPEAGCEAGRRRWPRRARRPNFRRAPGWLHCSRARRQVRRDRGSPRDDSRDKTISAMKPFRQEAISLLERTGAANA